MAKSLSAAKHARNHVRSIADIDDEDLAVRLAKMLAFHRRLTAIRKALARGEEPEPWLTS